MILPNRKSIRKAGYDYSQPGAYYITICVKDSRRLFGTIEENGVRLSDLGIIVREKWNQIPNRFQWTRIDEYIIMPDHFHGIVIIEQPLEELVRWRQSGGRGDPPLLPSLPEILYWFKSATNHEYLKLLPPTNMPTKGNTLWQRSYYDRIIRSEAELNIRRQYIFDNPQRWTNRNS